MYNHIVIKKISRTFVIFPTHITRRDITMKIAQLRQILEICNCGSINKAAEKLYISQSSLSASVISVENELEVSLFSRNRNGILLTPAGERFVQTAKTIVNDYDNFLASINTDESDRLFISSQYLRYANTVFANVNSKLKDVTTEFRFLEKSSNEVCADVMSKVSDIGIITMPTAARDKVFKLLHRNSLEGHLLSIDESRCIVGKDNPLCSMTGEYISIKQLADLPHLKYKRDEWACDIKIFNEEGRSVPCSRVITVGDTGSFNNMLINTNCFFIGIYNEHAYRNNSFYTNLRAFKMLDNTFYYDTIWIHRRNWTPNEPAKLYLSELYKTAGQMTFEDTL